MDILIINPYVYDFACYDYWMKPLGLLYLSSILKSKGHRVDMIDCMDRHISGSKTAGLSGEFGKGRFSSRVVPKPDVLKSYPRKYRRYGLNGKKLESLLHIKKRPDLVVLSVTMTYWYPSAAEIAGMVRRVWPGVKIAIGGDYVTLCREHAENSIDADYFFAGSGFGAFLNLIGESDIEFSQWPGPDYSSYGKSDYCAVRVTTGCERRCSFCGIGEISPEFSSKSPGRVKSEIETLSRRTGVRDFVFYDDSLLRGSFTRLLESFRGGRFRFHTPNGLEASRVDRDIALLLRESGFIDPCLSVDLTEHSAGGPKRSKTSFSRIQAAAENFMAAGYERGGVSAYLILGLPGQELEPLRADAEYVHSLGFRIRLAEYAVVPGTVSAESLEKRILEEPLLHNNSVFPAFSPERWDDVFRLKQYANRLNSRL